MKKTVLKLAALVLSFALALSALTVGATATETIQNGVPQSYERLLQKGDYTLYFDSDTAEIAVTTSNGGVWYSNPTGTDNSAREKSQVIVYYYEKRDLTAMDSFTGCISLEDKMTYENKDGSLTVAYDIGDDGFTADALPTVLTKERMEKDIQILVFIQ